MTTSTAGTIASVMESFDGNTKTFVTKAKKKEKIILKDMDTLEKILILYVASNHDLDDIEANEQDKMESIATGSQKW